MIKTRYGLLQKSEFINPDRHDEEVFEAHDDTDTLSLTPTSNYTTYNLKFVLLGDQNAGKSTLLHAFTDQANCNFTKLLSLIPFICSKFANYRLCDPQDVSSNNLSQNNHQIANLDLNQMALKYQDEGPFLDTDLAHCSIVLAVQDFLFFCTEIGISEKPSIRDLASKPLDFVILELLEIGGDHLDKIYNHIESASSATDPCYEICQASIRLIRNCSHILYMGNCSRPQHHLELRLQMIRKITQIPSLTYLASRIPKSSDSASLRDDFGTVFEDFARVLQEIDPEIPLLLSVSESLIEITQNIRDICERLAIKTFEVIPFDILVDTDKFDPAAAFLAIYLCLRHNVENLSRITQCWDGHDVLLAILCALSHRYVENNNEVAIQDWNDGRHIDDILKTVNSDQGAEEQFREMLESHGINLKSNASVPQEENPVLWTHAFAESCTKDRVMVAWKWLADQGFGCLGTSDVTVEATGIDRKKVKEWQAVEVYFPTYPVFLTLADGHTVEIKPRDEFRIEAFRWPFDQTLFLDIIRRIRDRFDAAWQLVDEIDYNNTCPPEVLRARSNLNWDEIQLALHSVFDDALRSKSESGIGVRRIGLADTALA